MLTVWTRAARQTDGTGGMVWWGAAPTTLSIALSPASYTVTGNAVIWQTRMPITVAALTWTGQTVGLSYSAQNNLGQYVAVMSGMLGRYSITETTTLMTTTTVSTVYLWLTEDQEFEVELHVRNGTSGDLEPATGLTGLTVSVCSTPGGSAIGSLTFSMVERGATGVYAALMDTATLVAGLSSSTYPEGTVLYLVLNKSGDIASRSWRKIVRRQRVGDG